MENILKSFEFESESVKLTLFIKKEIGIGFIRIFVDGNIISNNNNLKIEQSSYPNSNSFSLQYHNKSFFWISSNGVKGFQWENRKNTTVFSVYRNVTEMKDKYIIQREFISQISNYFYECIQKYMETKLLYETSLDEIISE
jgi:hypothetical protein